MAVRIVKLVGQGLNNTIITGGLVPKGVYNNATDYAVGDSVSYDGSSYVMHTNAIAGTIPTNTTYWQLLASKGDTGASGAGSSQEVYNEIPSGTINNSNTVFTTVNNYVAGKIRIYINTARQTIINDYTETGVNEVTFTSAPRTGDILIVDYTKS